MMMKSFTGVDEVPPMEGSSPGTPPPLLHTLEECKEQGEERKTEKTTSSVLQLCSRCSDCPTLRSNCPNLGCCLIRLLSILPLLLSAGQDAARQQRGRNNYSRPRRSRHSLWTPLPCLGHVFLIKRWAGGIIKASDCIMSAGRHLWRAGAP